MNPCSLGIVRFDGRGTVPYIVIRGQIFKYNFKSGTLDGAKTNEVGLDNVLKDRTIINQPIVGNFDGNAAGREQILFTVSSGDGKAVNIGGYYYKPSDYDASKATGPYQHTGTGKNAMDDTNGVPGEGLRSCRWGMNAWGISEIALAAPDIDDDGIIAKYTGKEYAFNDPQVLAVMEAPRISRTLSTTTPARPQSPSLRAAAAPPAPAPRTESAPMFPLSRISLLAA